MSRIIYSKIFKKQFKQQNLRTYYLHIGKSTKEIHRK